MDPQTTPRPSIALLLRVIYQHHSQAIESALRAAGFNDIAPSAGNVFPFMRPEGITISALAELAGVRKQTMAQAIDQLMDKLDRQVVRHKDKLNDHHHTAAKRIDTAPQ